ncbi:MAG: hypothetical protein KDB00_19070 [Planctomycetales bacterium]|nr:hypothetical protein [Planctomycetales bacterium]
MMRFSSLLMGVCLACVIALAAKAESTSPEDSVSYSRDIVPILQQNCVACHRAKQAEGGLSLETTKSLLVGGDSGALWEGTDPESSLLYARVTDEDDPMPPDDNNVGAKRLTQQQLALVRKWITQGATIDRHSDSEIDWQPIPETIRSTYSLAVSPSDQTVAIGHANRVELLDAQTGKSAGVLADNRLNQSGVADVDVVQAIAFSPLGDLIATGGYQTVRIWKRQPEMTDTPPALQRASGPVALNPERTAVAIVNAIGEIEVWDLSSDQKSFLIPASAAATDLVWNQAESIVVGYESGDLGIYSGQDGSTSVSLKLDHSVAEVDQSPDGRFIATLGSEGQVRLFESHQPKQITSLDSVQDATSIAFTSSNALAVGSASGVAFIIDPAADKVVYQLNHESPVRTLSAGSKFNRIATGGSDGRAKIWNLDDGKLIHTLVGDLESQLRIVSLDNDVTREESWLQTLDKKTEELNKLLETENAALAKVTEAREAANKALAEKTKLRDDSAAQITATESKIAESNVQMKQAEESATAAEGLIAKSKSQLEKTTAELQPLEKLSADAVAELKEAQAKADEAMRLLSVAKESSTELANRVAEKKAQILAEQKMNEEAVAKLTAAKKLSTEAKAKVESETAALEKQKAALAAAEKEVQTKQADLAEREQALVTATKTRDQVSKKIPVHQNTIRLRRNELSDLKFRRTTLTSIRDHGPSVSSIALTDDELTAVVVDVNGGVRTFDAQSGKPIGRFQLPQTSSLALSSNANMIDGERLVVYNRSSEPQVITLRQGWSLLRTIGGIGSDLIADRVTALDFRGDGESIAIGSGTPSRDGQVMIVATATGEVLRRFENIHSDSVLAVRFSPDDRVLATASADKTIRLLDVQSKEVIGALDGHTHHVLSIAWKKDGRMIASGSADGTIKTWDVETGQQIRTIGGFPDEVTSVAFIGDSSRVVSSCANGQVRVHDTNNGGQVWAATAQGDFLFATGITAGGARIFSAGQKGTVNVWETEGLKSIGTWE